jgi:LacI family asc operon transcriptional repressor
VEPGQRRGGSFELLPAAKHFTALVASNDDMAIGAMKQLHDSGVATPERCR